jgi:CTP synthase
MKKHIFVTGGVNSSLGKGIITASIANLLKRNGLKIFVKKIDPYINVDSGLMNPYQHGEVFVTYDGGETDLDLGHYERFTDFNAPKYSCITSGQIFNEVINQERKGFYQGETIQIVPHITNKIKERICFLDEKNKDVEIIISEIGGTVGDIESSFFIEAIRQLKLEKGKENVLFIHVTPVPENFINKEIKTKQTQHSLRLLLSLGIQPDFLICRSRSKLDNQLKEKLALFSNIEAKNIYNAYYCESIYQMPEILKEERIIENIIDHFEIKKEIIDNDQSWKKFLEKINYEVNSKKNKKEITIKIVGKYSELNESYLSILESLKISSFELAQPIKIELFNSQFLNKNNVEKELSNIDAILVPGGFGERGVQGKMIAIEYARLNKIPFLGICLGMQLACLELAKNVLKKNIISEESNSGNDLILNIKKENNNQKKENEKLILFKKGILKLGSEKVILEKNTIAYKIYKKEEIFERYRSRYHFNKDLKNLFLKTDLIFSGLSADEEPEIIELLNHPYFIACQYHPEFLSRPTKPHPLFTGLIKATIK